MRQQKYLLILVLLLLYASNAFAEDSVSIRVCQDCSQNYSQLETEKFGEYNREIAINGSWLEIIVRNQNKKILLFGQIDSVELYYRSHKYLSGKNIPLNEKTLKYTRNVLPIPAYGEAFYVRLKDQRDSVYFQFEEFSLEEFQNEYVSPSKERIYFQLFFQGTLWVIILYNLLTFISSREKVYFYYSFYLFGLSIFFSQNEGIALYYLPNSKLSWLLPLGSVGITIALYGYISFLLYFLPAKTINKFWQKFFKYCRIGVLLMGCFYLYALLIEKNVWWYVYSTLTFLGILLPSFLVFFGYLLINHRANTTVRYFVFGSAFLVVTALIANVSQLYGAVAYSWLELGGMVEILIFSLGLGNRMKELEQENANILAGQNKLLEETVLERTTELRKQQAEVLTQNEELHQQQEEILAQRDFISTQNDKLNNSNIRFTDSVRYAQTIQEAILPYDGKLNKLFSEHFILYKPKDIVSGDFYWMNEVFDEESGETIHFLGVLDCTGHGVPGAFISLIGYALLNEIVSKENIKSPDLILKRLHERIRKSLKQKHTNNQDGMDAVLCAIRLHADGTRQVTFSGAKNALYLRKDGEFVQLKGDRVSIGGFLRKRKETLFSRQTISLSKGDCIYLTTDGFADQNNDIGKKIGSKSFCNYLQEITHLPMEKQLMHLESLLKNHKGRQAQRDDITILGVRI